MYREHIYSTYEYRLLLYYNVLSIYDTIYIYIYIYIKELLFVSFVKTQEWPDRFH
jgi:hypothetical protein